MDLGLAGKVAIVTGGGSGIGKATCHALAAEGARVVVADLYQERAETVAHDVAKSAGQALAIAGDVSNAAHVHRMFETVVKNWGGVDVMVNNAGVILQAQTVDMTTEQWDKILTNNLTSCFL